MAMATAIVSRHWTKTENQLSLSVISTLAHRHRHISVAYGVWLAIRLSIVLPVSVSV